MVENNIDATLLNALINTKEEKKGKKMQTH